MKKKWSGLDFDRQVELVIGVIAVAATVIYAIVAAKTLSTLNTQTAATKGAADAAKQSADAVATQVPIMKSQADAAVTGAKAAVASIEALRQSNETAQRQLALQQKSFEERKPFITVTRMKLKSRFGPNQPIVLQMTFKNTGSRPATDIILNFFTWTEDATNVRPEKYKWKPFERNGNAIPTLKVGEEGERELEMAPLSPEEVRLIRARTMFLTIRGTIRSTDPQRGTDGLIELLPMWIYDPNGAFELGKLTISGR